MKAEFKTSEGKRLTFRDLDIGDTFVFKPGMNVHMKIGTDNFFKLVDRGIGISYYNSPVIKVKPIEIKDDGTVIFSEKE